MDTQSIGEYMAKKEHFSISITQNAHKLLHEHCVKEKRNKSNMLEVMIHAYNDLMKKRY